MIPYVKFEPGLEGTRVKEAGACSFGDLPDRFPHVELASKKAGHLISFATYRPGATRGQKGIEAMHAIVLDFDALRVGDAERVLEHLNTLGLAYWYYTSFSHRDPSKVVRGTAKKDDAESAARVAALTVRGPFDSLRTVFPLSRPVDVELWTRVAGLFIPEVVPPWFATSYPKPPDGEHPKRGLDGRSFQPEQGWFEPATRVLAEGEPDCAMSDLHRGEPVDVDWYAQRAPAENSRQKIVVAGSGPLERVHAALARKGIVVEETSPGQFNACCPAHADTTPSFGYSTDEDGNVWMQCFSGCEKPAILAALGLSLRDLYVERTEIVLSPLWIHKTVEKTVEVLSHDKTLFQQQRQLVTVGSDPSRKDPGAQVVPAADIKERLSRLAVFVAVETDKEGEKVRKPIVIPGDVVGMVNTRGHWDEIRPLQGLLQSPTLRADGSLLAEPGYDAATRLYLARTLPVQVPEKPAYSDAIRARDTLLDLVVDFPFATREDMSVWLALVLTRACRRAISGAVPLFVMDAPKPGTGKSLLGQLACQITLGRKQPTESWTDDTDELRKRLLAQAMVNTDCVFFDNVTARETLGGGPLEMAVTASIITDRVLGESRMAEAPLEVTWLASGNNLRVSDDMKRRTLWCRVDANRPDPENRSGFKYTDVEAHVAANHAHYLSAALTLVRAFMVAGKPATAKRLGSFESWSSLIAGAVVWVGMPDPISTQERQRQEAPDDLIAAYVAIATTVRDLQATRPGGVYVRDLIAADVYQTYREAAETSISGKGPGGALTRQQVSELLKRMRGVALDLDGQTVKLAGRTDRANATCWYVDVVGLLDRAAE